VSFLFPFGGKLDTMAQVYLKYKNVLVVDVSLVEDTDRWLPLNDMFNLFGSIIHLKL
jgi:hypothetical protein